jgi:hypothetical protein
MESIHRDFTNAENMGEKFQHPRMFGMQDKLSLVDFEKCGVCRNFLEYYELNKEIPHFVNFSSFIKTETEFQLFRK